jgi:hypothetical protein
MVANGDVIQVNGEPAIYYVEGGMRRHVPNMQTFWAREFYPDQVKFISKGEMSSIPVGPQLEVAALHELRVRDFLGSGHYMETRGSFSTFTGRIRATTSTWTSTWFGGFHGGVVVMGFDQSPERYPLFATTARIYGVDGTWIGKSRYDGYWEETIAPDTARRVGEIRVVHAWYPRDLATTVRKAVDTVTPLATLAGTIAGFAKLSGAAPVKQ